MQLAIRPAVIPRPMLFFVAAALLAVALAGVLFVAGSRRPTPPPFGPAGNGAILTGIGTELLAGRCRRNEPTPAGDRPGRGRVAGVLAGRRSGRVPDPGRRAHALFPVRRERRRLRRAVRHRRHAGQQPAVGWSHLVSGRHQARVRVERQRGLADLRRRSRRDRTPPARRRNGRPSDSELVARRIADPLPAHAARRWRIPGGHQPGRDGGAAHPPGRTGRCVVQGIAVDARWSDRLFPLEWRHPRRGYRRAGRPRAASVEVVRGLGQPGGLTRRSPGGHRDGGRRGDRRHR